MTARARLLLAAGTAIGAALIAPAAPTAAAARAGTAGACPTLDDGVTVIVDAVVLGGAIEVRCAPGAPSSGLAALQAAGFSYGFVQGQPGLVCTIDSRPDPCNGAPADAYWGYYHASRGGTWSYSNLGAAAWKPAVGSVEGWSFGDSREPGVPPPFEPVISPPPAPAPPPSPAPSPQPSPSPSPSPTPGLPGGGVPPAPPGVPTTSRGGAPSTTADPGTTEVTRDGAPTTTGDATTTSGSPAQDDAAERDGGGSVPGDAGATEQDEVGWGEALALLTALLVIGGLIVAGIYIRWQLAKDALGDSFRGPESEV